MNDLKSLARTAISTLMLAGCIAAYGQSQFPVKPIRIVTSEAGGVVDLATRLIAQGLTASMGQQVIVDNRGGGVIAGEFVAKAAPDGYTLLSYGNTFYFLPLMRDHMPYDPAKDFLPVTVSVRGIAVPPRVRIVVAPI